MRTLFLLGALTGSLPFAGLAKPFDTLLSGDANLIFSVRDISELREDWSEHPLVRDFSESSLDALFKDLFGQSAGGEKRAGFDELLEEFALDEEDLFELFGDQAALALYNLPELLLQESERPDFALLADFSGSAERLDELMQIQFARNAEAQREVNPAIEHEMVEERFMGETLYFDEVFDGETTYIEDGYALVDGVFILARPEARLRTLVESVKIGADSAIASSLAYQRACEASGPADLMLYANLESTLTTLNQALLDKAMEGGMAMFGVSGKSLEAALALRALTAFYIDCELGEENIRSRSGILYREKAGLLQLLAYEKGGVPSANFVPEGVLSSTVARFDLSEMFAQLEALLGVASPSMPALINIQLQQVKTKTGVDLRSAFLENFGSEFVSFSLMPDDRVSKEVFAPAQHAYVIGIKDAAALSGALEALKDMIPGARAQIKTRDFQGETIHTFPGIANPSMPDATRYNFSYAVTRTHLIYSVGRAGLIQAILTSMQSRDAGFWQMEETEEMIDRIGRTDVVSRSYTDLGEVVASLAETLSGAALLSGNAGKFDPGRLLSPDLPWHMMTETYEAPDGIFSEMLLVRKEVTR